jgi:hypothetical protein
MVNSDYLHNAIVKFNPTTGAGTVIHLDTFSLSFAGDGSGELFLMGNNIVGMMTGCGPASTNPTDFLYYACKFSVPVK